MGKNEAGVLQGSDALIVSEVRDACPLGALLVGLPLGGFSGTLIYAQALAFFSSTSGAGAAARGVMGLVGLLVLVNSENELAAVLGHEMAHDRGLG